MNTNSTLGATRTIQRRMKARWRDLDPLGHVNTAVFLTYLEEARDAWLVQVFGQDFVPQNYVVARIEIDYRQQILHGQEILVSCQVGSVGRRSITTREEIRSSDGDVLAEATVVIVLWDDESHTSRPLTESEYELLEEVSQ